MAHSSTSRTTSTIAQTGDIQTGLPVLDRSLKQLGAHSRQVLHVQGGEQQVQLALLLGFCLAANVGKRRSVFFDLTGVLSPQLIKRAGLLPYYNPALPADPNSGFRVLSPTTPQEVTNALNILAKLSATHSVVVIHGLPELLERHYLKGGVKEPDVARAGKALEGLIKKAHALLAKASFTLWIAHLPAESTVSGTASSNRADSASHSNAKGSTIGSLPLRLVATLAHKLDMEASYGIELGQAMGTNTHCEVPVQVWRRGKPLDDSQMLHMENDGRFKTS